MNKTLRDIGEFGLIRMLRDIISDKGYQDPAVTTTIGDDASSFRPHNGYELLITCDSMVEGRHFLWDYTIPFDIGRRAMVANISDIGAMGGLPLYAIVSLGLGPDTATKKIKSIYMGFLEELNPLKASIIGGNVTRSDHGAIIDITMIGEARNNKILRRSTAKTGDALLVTGYPGQASAGLRLLLNTKNPGDISENLLVRAYNSPSHRAREGRAIAESGYATSMIDTSDGLIGDLGHICEESGVGADIYMERLPVSEPMRDINLNEDETIYDIVMNDSDDYEMLFTCPRGKVAEISSIVKGINNVPVTEIGVITQAHDGINIRRPDGPPKFLRSGGWDHFHVDEEDNR
jgi:thiamine-monophosphate kinase